MNVQPSKHLILINGHTHQGPWFERNSQLSFDDPFAFVECWRNCFNNKIINEAQNLWKNYHFMGSTDRISVFGPRPYSDAIAHLWIADHCNPRRPLILGKTPVFEPILYCGFCNQYASSNQPSRWYSKYNQSKWKQFRIVRDGDNLSKVAVATSSIMNIKLKILVIESRIKHLQ